MAAAHARRRSVTPGSSPPPPPHPGADPLPGSCSPPAPPARPFAFTSCIDVERGVIYAGHAWNRRARKALTRGDFCLRAGRIVITGEGGARRDFFGGGSVLWSPGRPERRLRASPLRAAGRESARRGSSPGMIAKFGRRVQHAGQRLRTRRRRVRGRARGEL